MVVHIKHNLFCDKCQVVINHPDILSEFIEPNTYKLHYVCPKCGGDLTENKEK
jgi:Zn finger protein HypA/HybF involved in hydrogenase expression